jgi:hypothetical protein
MSLVDMLDVPYKFFVVADLLIKNIINNPPKESMTLTVTNIAKILTQCNVFYTVIAILYWDFWMELLILARCILSRET